MVLLIVIAVNINSCINKSFLNRQLVLENKAYYFSISGKDGNDGTIGHPFKTISKLNSLHLQPGDIIYLKGGDIFNGSILVDSSEAGMRNNPIRIRSYGNGYPVINSSDSTALTIYKSKYVEISKLILAGSGRKSGNTKNGIAIMESSDISIDSVEVSGFQKAGVFVYSASAINISHVHAHENGSAGILVEAEYGTKGSYDILISDCLADNNPGDPSNFTNHSGNGIIAGNCRNVAIEYCIATNNGWDMPRIGNGPVGIWCYEADSVTIQYCISYKNKTSSGADDGGGFDFDGGVTNSLIQYCLSYENHGSAFGIFQYNGASDWHDNVIRKNISQDDGAVSAAHASAYIWNSSGDPRQFRNLSFYDNIIYNTKGAAIHYADKQSNREGFDFSKNIFIAKKEIIKGKVSDDNFSGNTWWSLANGFNVDSVMDFKNWAMKTGKETSNGKITGINKNPDFKDAGFTKLKDTHELKSFIDYQLKKCEEMKWGK